ncbi:hypothetical protein AAFF_G00402290 [Aldrovandia affinis]|uniref:Uncharacterized protein n=1 Tax=Aldrovandia affinis TaxID=143900 RepID=A0AAD7T846_9TELE|nr:hypothetical protein AAFF_G00402290 [Aldrovandia affinis]
MSSCHYLGAGPQGVEFSGQPHAWASVSVGTMGTAQGDVKPWGSQCGSQTESAFPDKELASAHTKCQLAVGLIFKVTRGLVARCPFEGQERTALVTNTVTKGF